MDKTDYQISNKRTKKNSSNPSRIGTNTHILLSPDGCDRIKSAVAPHTKHNKACDMRLIGFLDGQSNRLFGNKSNQN
jgi:hypothetical protein